MEEPLVGGLSEGAVELRRDEVRAEEALGAIRETFEETDGWRVNGGGRVRCRIEAVHFTCKERWQGVVEVLREEEGSDVRVGT